MQVQSQKAEIFQVGKRNITYQKMIDYWGNAKTALPLPFLGSGNVIFLSLTSTGLIFSTSPMRIPPLAMSSNMMRFRGLAVLKIISSIESFSN